VLIVAVLNFAFALCLTVPASFVPSLVSTRSVVTPVVTTETKEGQPLAPIQAQPTKKGVAAFSCLRISVSLPCLASSPAVLVLTLSPVLVLSVVSLQDKASERSIAVVAVDSRAF
jgi:hypothetical protein